MSETTTSRGQFAPLTPEQRAGVEAYDAPLALFIVALFAVAGFLATRKTVNDLRRRHAPVSRYELTKHCE